MAHNLELLWALTSSDIRAKYKQSIVGIFWAVLPPLAMMFVFDLVFGRLLKVDTGGVPYPIFVYSTLVPWLFFVNALTKGTSSIEMGSGIIKKIALPRVMFPLSAILSTFVDFLAAAVVFIGMMFYFHVVPTPWILMVIPLVALQLLLTIGLSLLLSSLNAYFRDVRYGLPLVVQLWMYASPIVYAVSVVPARLQFVYNLNPITGLMVSYRNVLVYGVAPDWSLLYIAVLVTGVVLIIGYSVFNRLEGTFSDVI